MDLFSLITVISINSTIWFEMNSLVAVINEKNYNHVLLIGGENYCRLHKNPLIISSIYHQNSNLTSDIIIITGSWKLSQKFLNNNQASRFGREILILVLTSKNNINLLTYFSILWNNYRLRNVLIFHQLFVYYIDNFSGKFLKWNYWEAKTALDYLEKIINRNKIDFKGSPLRVSIFDPTYRKLPTPISKEALFQIGIDGRVLFDLSLFYNASILITTSSETSQYGGITKDGVLVGALGDIVSLRADFAANARFIKIYESSKIELTTAVGIDQLCVMVPAAGRIPEWEAILSSIPSSDWTAIGCLYVLISGFLILISSLRRRQFNLSNIFNILFNTARPFLDTPFPRIPNNSAERILIISLYICYGLFLTEFRSQLFGQIQSHSMYHQINSLKEFLSSGLCIQVSYGNLADTFGGDKDENDKDTLMEHLLNRITIKRTPISGKIAQLKRRRDFEQNNKYHLISECPRTYFLAYAIPQGSFLQPSLNIFLIRALSYGAFKYWTLEEARQKNSSKFLKSTGTSMHEFSLDDLALAFWVFAMGMIISILIFLIELSWKYFCLRKNLIFPHSFN